MSTDPTLLLLALAAVVAYLAACAFWPYLACRRCGGSGKRRSPLDRGWRSCRRCQGTGRRVRFGRRVAELFRSGD